MLVRFLAPARREFLKEGRWGQAFPFSREVAAFALFRRKGRALFAKRAIMTYDEFNDFCGGLPATSYVVQWRGSHVWKVGGKVFAIGGWSDANKPAYTFKVSETNFHFLEHKPGYRPAPYLASRGMKWIQQYDAPAAEDDALQHYLRESHRIVSLGFSRKRQKELGLNPTA